MSKKKDRKPEVAPDAESRMESLVKEIATRRRAITAAKRGLEIANESYQIAVEACQLAEADLRKEIEMLVQAAVGPEAGHLQPADR